MATLLSTTNRILRRLREDTVTEVTNTDYTILIADFVSEAYEDTAEEFDWSYFYHSITVALVSAQAVYNLTRTIALGGDVENGNRTAKFDSYLEYDTENVLPSVRIFDNSADTDGSHLIVLEPATFNQIKADDRTETDIDPTYVTFYPDSSNELQMEIYPIPNAVREVELRMWTKPDALAVDGSDDATIIIGNDRMVYALALMWAYNERGEEIGEPGNLAERRYISAVTKAKEQDMQVRSRARRYDWVRG